MAVTKLSFTKLVVLALAAAVLVEFSAATTYTVGDNTGWLNPSGNPTFYSNWTSNHTFVIGDILVFNYATGQHTVATVTKNAYDTCNSTSPISLDTIGPTNVTLNTTGEHYYICTVGSHCNEGQKLAINVSSSTTASPPSSPPTTSPSPSPPPSPTASPPPSTTAPPPSPTASPPPSTTAPPPSSTASPPPPSSPSPGSPTSPTTGTSPPPPPSSSAPPKTVAAFAVVLMSIAIGVIC